MLITWKHAEIETTWEKVVDALLEMGARVHALYIAAKRGNNFVLSSSIIESVDSNVGIARTRSISQYIKISPNLKNGELISLYDNVLFIFECFRD